MSMNIPDNYDIWRSHDAEQERRIARLPRCSECDNHITTEYAYYINGEWLCDKCMDSYRQPVPEE